MGKTVTIIAIIVLYMATLVIADVTPAAEVDRTSVISEGPNEPYISPTPGEIPIVGYAPVPGRVLSLIKSEELGKLYEPEFDTIAKSMLDAGINAFVITGQHVQVEPMLKAGLRIRETTGKVVAPILLIGNFTNTLERIEEINKRYVGKEYPYAFLLMDEPRYNDWGDAFYQLDDNNGEPAGNGNTLRWNRLTLADAITKYYHPDRMRMFNLVSSGEWWHNSEWSKPADDVTGSCKNYEEYLDVLQRLYRPAMWSYDMYPFVIIAEDANKMGLGPGNLKTNPPAYTQQRKSFFYHNLEIFLRQSQKTGRPFWTYAMTSGCGGWVVDTKKWLYYLPAPTLGMLRFQFFNSLASGAQGLVYWEYGQGWDTFEPDPGEESLAIFGDAPLMATIGPAVDGKKKVITFHFRDNEHWHIARTVNSEIRQLEKVFLGTDVIGYGHVNGGQEYDGLATLRLPFGPVTEISTGDEGVFVSHLRTNGNDYLVVVNHDAFNVQKNIQLKLSNKYGYATIWGKGKRTGAPITGPANSDNANKVKFSLSPGNFHIIRFWKK